jgi:hypothetical protein
MPSYITNPQVSQVKALYPGDSLALVNSAATDSGITKTIQFTAGKLPGYTPVQLVFNNTSNQTATIHSAASDAEGNYQPVTNGDTGNAATVAASKSEIFTLVGPWFRCTYSTAPTTGSLIVSR